MKLLIALISVVISSVLIYYAGGERGKLELVNHTQNDFYYFTTITSEKGPYSFHPDSITIPKLESGKSITLEFSDNITKWILQNFRLG